ncbi:MAG: O-antigen ligase family protein, partial [Gemmatimonadota bacterium]|nr:O-antigen ligase family protein [Gemmatimonadota bacterium]
MAQTVGSGAEGPVPPSVPRISGTRGDSHRGRPLTAAFPLTFPAENRLYSLWPSAIWRVLKRQPPSFWLVCVYLFFEYVRPQNIYERIQGPPYARVVIILALVAFLLERRTIRFRMPELLLTIFSVVVLASSVTAFQPSASYEKISGYLSWVLIYLLIANVVDTEERFLVFMLSFLLYSLKMSQYGTRSWAEDGFAFRKWGTTGAPGFFQNSGDFGVQMCIFLPLIVAFILALGPSWPRWMRWVTWGIAGTAVTGIVASSSRGAVVGLAAVILWALLKSRQKVRSLFATIVLAALVYVIIPPQSKLRFEQAGDDQTSVARITMWKHALNMMGDFPILGVGFNNWIPYHDTYYGGHGTMTHNIFLEAGSELGYTGLAAFLALIGCTFVINSRTRKLAASIPNRGRFM